MLQSRYRRHVTITLPSSLYALRPRYCRHVTRYDRVTVVTLRVTIALPLTRYTLQSRYLRYATRYDHATRYDRVTVTTLRDTIREVLESQVLIIFDSLPSSPLLTKIKILSLVIWNFLKFKFLHLPYLKFKFLDTTKNCQKRKLQLTDVSTKYNVYAFNNANDLKKTPEIR